MGINALFRKLGGTWLVIGAVAACGRMSPPVMELESSGPPAQENPSPQAPEGPSEGAPDWVARPPDEIHEAEKKDQLCYPGNGSGPLCLNLVTPNDAEFRSHYRYLDPRTTPTFPQGLDPKQYMPPQKFIYLPGLAAALPVAKNFELNEFMSATKGSYGLFSPYVVAALQRIRDTTRRALLLTSAYRSPSYNQSVGGTDWSRHTYGDGVDIWADRSSKNVIANACRRFGAGFTLIYQTHVHCDWRAVGSASTAEESRGGSDTELLSVDDRNRGLIHPSGVDHLMQSRLGIRESESAELEHGGIFRTHGLERNGVVLTADYFDMEGEGVPELEWTVVAPNGERTQLEGQNAVFVPGQLGVHRLKLTLGGRYTVQKDINVR